MNSLIQILFVKSHNGFADQSQVYRGEKKIKIIFPLVYFSIFQVVLEILNLPLVAPLFSSDIF